MAKPLPLQDRVLTLSRLAGLADRHHDVWWFYESPDGRGADLSSYWEFVKLEMHGHRALCILYLSAFLCGDHKSTHIGEVLDEMDQLGMAPGLVAEAREAIAKIAPKVQQMTIIRSAAIAHRSRRISHDDAYRKADLKVDDLKELAGTVRAMGTALADLFEVQRPDAVATLALEDLNRLFAPKRRDRRSRDPLAVILEG